MREPSQTRGQRGAQDAVQLSLWDAPPAAAGGRADNAVQGVEVSASPAVVRPAGIFRRVFRRLELRAPAAEFEVRFRPFTSLRSSIALKGGKAIQAQLSDLLEAAPPLVVEALAEILISGLFGRRPSREARECYKAWVHSPAVVRRLDEVRRARGRKRLLPPEGRCYNLAAIFDDLNRRFFEGALGRIHIGWSPHRSRSQLGHYDTSHHTITISRWLDSPRVPKYVVEYLVFHEMLHVGHPIRHRNHRRIVHSGAFLEAERKFPHYAKAVRYLRSASPRREFAELGEVPRAFCRNARQFAQTGGETDGERR